MFRVSSAEDVKQALDEAFVNEILEASLACPPTRSLDRCAPCEALPRQQEIIFDVLARARAEGLTIPEGLPIYGVAGDGRLHGGEAGPHRRTRVLSVWLDVGTGVLPESLAAVCFHEFFHVSDYVTGRPFNRLDWEHRAYDYSARAMAKWWPRLSGWR